MDKATVNRDFEKHNQEVKEVWASFQSEQPIRIPLQGGVSIRYYLDMCKYNFRDYFLYPEIMLKYQLELQKFNRFNITGDAPAGLPEEWDGIMVDFQNVYEAGWLGCEIEYPEDDVPWSKPILNENKAKLNSLKIPQAHDNLMGKMIDCYDFFKEKSENMLFEGRKIKTPRLPVWTMGPFSLATDLRGATELCTDVYDDPGYVHQLLDLATKSVIARIKICYELMGIDDWGGLALADDSVVMLSEEKYREFVLPYHKKLFKIFSEKDKPNFMHLCGPAEHLGKILHDELNIRDFETGFATDFQKLKEEMGPDVLYHRTVHPLFLHNKTESQIYQDTKQFIDPEIRENRRLIIRTSNVIAPGTPIEDLKAIYQAIRKYGYYKNI